MTGVRSIRAAEAVSVAGTPPFRVLLACEARRLWRGVWPWLFVAAVPAVFALTGRWRARALQHHLGFLLYLSLLAAALSAFTAWAAQRDRRSGTDEVTLSWPVSSRRLYLARTVALGSLTLALWLEAALPSLAYTAFSYATAARAAGVPIPLTDLLGDGGLIALSLAASFLGAQAAGQLAAALLPGLGGLVALVLYRAFTLGGPRVILATLQWPYALLTSPEFIWEGWPRLAQCLQLGLFADVFLAHQAFWVLGSLGLLVALACLFHPRRDLPRRRSRLLAATALSAVAVCALPFIALERGYVASHARAVAAYGEAVKPPLRLRDSPHVARLEDPAAVAPRPLRYDLDVDISRPPEVRVWATVEMHSRPAAPRDSITLTLRRAFEVDEVRLDGVAAPFAREGDLLRLRPEQPLPTDRPFAVSLRYHGRVADWRLDSHETPAALAAGEFLWLPSTWGWYPVPGEHRLTWEIGMSSLVFRALADRTAPCNDAEPAFNVTVRAPAGIRFLAGFAQDGEGAWRLQAARNQLTLLGGNWWPCGEGAVRYAVPFEELDTWQDGVGDAQRLLVALVDWTGIGPLNVVPSPVSLVNAGDLSLIHAEWFLGPVYQLAPDPQGLTWSAGSWFYDLLRLQPRFRAPALPEVEAAEYASPDDLHALRAYALAQVFADAFGPGTPAAPPGSDVASPPTVRVEAWAARTPREAQKAALRRLFHDAQLRMLVPADLAFLDEEALP